MKWTRMVGGGVSAWAARGASSPCPVVTFAGWEHAPKNVAESKNSRECSRIIGGVSESRRPRRARATLSWNDEEAVGTPRRANELDAIRDRGPVARGAIVS